MGNFADALKEERKRARKTLKEVSDEIGRSIGYLSDIEQSRSGPPDIEIVRQIETFLGTQDSRLVNLAMKERDMSPKTIVQNIQGKPLLRDIYFRVKDMTDEELRELIDRGF